MGGMDVKGWRDRLESFRESLREDGGDLVIQKWKEGELILELVVEKAEACQDGCMLPGPVLQQLIASELMAAPDGGEIRRVVVRERRR